MKLSTPWIIVAGVAAFVCVLTCLSGSDAVDPFWPKMPLPKIG